MTTDQNAAQAITDGILRRVSDRLWESFLDGYRVEVFHSGGWYFATINSQFHTKLCPRVESFAEGAWRAVADKGGDANSM